MGVLQRFERRVEGLVQGAFARAFGGYVEPVEVAAALTREAEDRKSVVGQGRVLVPNQYVVELGASDVARLREYDAPLRNELAAMVREAADEHGWSFVGPVEVVFQDAPEFKTGTFKVRSAAVETGGAPLLEVRPAQPQPAFDAGATTYLPTSAGPAAYLELDGKRVPLQRSTVLGRGTEADLRLPDTGVSRRHAEVRVVVGSGEISDLGSTNGTRVNGHRIDRPTPLADGDQLTLGTTTLVYRTG